MYKTATLVCLAGAAQGQTATELAAQAEAYDAVQPKGIAALQPLRHEVTAPLKNGTVLRFIALNPQVNAWVLVQLETEDGKVLDAYHLENPDPSGQGLTLSTQGRPALALGGHTPFRCAPWLGESSALDAARASGLPFAPVCQNRLFLRNSVSGSRSNLEATTEFLRDHVWGGEQIVRFVKGTFFRDSEMTTSEALSATGQGRLDLGPGAATMDYEVTKRPVISTYNWLGIEGTDRGHMTTGLWYPITGLPGVFTSAMQPRYLAQSVLKGEGTTSALDAIERKANASLVGFDLGRFDLSYAVGTDHPGLGWSPRPPYSVRPQGMPGPDGVKNADPLVRLGMVPPHLADRTVAVFAGGFKRHHGAFKWGDYITLNFGTHYGFIENGVILSKLQPHLSTLYVLADGTIGMKTWEEADNALLPRIRHARQNGVSLIEDGIPGPLVTQWGAGNWSGSAEAELRTLRGGACIKEAGGTRWLIYGYFSTATPSAMARTFQGYGCDYAMLLDMNALEHTHLALFVRNEGQMHVEHLMPGMALIEKKARDGSVIPRFLGFVDNRDFFYLTVKEGVK
ncbi:hypothetical protein [Aliiroseovarius subalbicans]|uniref:hypothetical protein n=1 Tax=Aliiroseovarius subalbicans TaxID=2925840 RepID=UPI001F55C850|nr:hypothetical protein [Aliiroseovarius subalbicans]MCI2398936.1 hypothetical protein [Aliiroseovarius subalbicans]